MELFLYSSYLFLFSTVPIFSHNHVDECDFLYNDRNLTKIWVKWLYEIIINFKTILSALENRIFLVTAIFNHSVLFV